MTTTNPQYNPIRNALAELVSPSAWPWYWQQVKLTPSRLRMFALWCVAFVQQFRSPAIAELKNEIAIPSKIASLETTATVVENEDAIAPTIAPAVQSDGDAVEGLEDAIALSSAIAQTEATESEDFAEPHNWEAIEANATFATAQEETIAQANEPEPCDHAIAEEANANDSATRATEAQDWEPDEAIAAVAFSEAGMQGFGDAIASDGDTFAWVDGAFLDDEDPTELRQWTEAEDLDSAIAQTTELDAEDDTFFSAEPEQAEDFAEDSASG